VLVKKRLREKTKEKIIRKITLDFGGWIFIIILCLVSLLFAIIYPEFLLLWSTKSNYLSININKHSNLWVFIFRIFKKIKFQTSYRWIISHLFFIY